MTLPGGEQVGLEPDSPAPGMECPFHGESMPAHRDKGGGTLLQAKTSRPEVDPSAHQVSMRTAELSWGGGCQKCLQAASVSCTFQITLRQICSVARNQLPLRGTGEFPSCFC